VRSSSVLIADVGQNPDLIEQSLAVLQAGLGEGFIMKERFLEYAVPRTWKPFRGALVALDENTHAVLGALTIEIVDAKALTASFLDSYELVRKDIDEARLHGGNTGLIKSIAVSQAHHGRGIATQLIAVGINELARHGAERFYSLAWESRQSGCHLCGVLASLGFREVRRIERFWYRDSLATGYACLMCGNPCECAVRVMVK